MKEPISHTLANTERYFLKKNLCTFLPCPCCSIYYSFLVTLCLRKYFRTADTTKILVFHEVWNSAEVVLESLGGFGISWVKELQGSALSRPVLVCCLLFVPLVHPEVDMCGPSESIALKNGKQTFEM